MSKVVIKGDASGTGTLTIAAPNTNTDRAIALPDAAGTVFVSGQALSATTGSFSGDVGIGTSSPTYKLQVNEASTTGGVEIVNISTSGTQLADNYADLSFRLGNSSTRAAIIRGITNGNSAGNGHELAFLTSANSEAPTERLRIDSSGNLKFNSGYGSVATAYGCRAWVNFNGSGTVAIRASGNVSSITDNNVGDYTVNFSTAMPDANYAVAALGRNTTDNTGLSGCTVDSNLSHTRTASAFKIQTKRGSTAIDSTEVTLAIFR